MRQRAFRRMACSMAFALLSPIAAHAAEPILSEGFEGTSLDPRITVATAGDPSWGVKSTTVFGSDRAFGFGRSSCWQDCWGDFTSTLVITFPRPVYVSSLSFKEIELYGNIGSGGVVLIDGVPLVVHGRAFYETFGRLPYNDGVADTTYRTRALAINGVVSRIEIQSWDIAGHSEILIDDLAVTGVEGGVALFDQNTDTIAVAGQFTLANAATYEARVLFTSTFAGDGLVFDEWKSGLEDKFLGVGPTSVSAYSFRLHDDVMVAGASLAPNAWHHVAYVYDGTQERLYLDGTQVGARPAAGSMENSDGPAFVGAIFRDGGISPGFIGYLDTLRISNVARYSGYSFTPPPGDLSRDSDTLLLYNFNDDARSATVADLSGNDHTGTLGSGFTGATAPVLTVDPMRLSGVGTATVDGVMAPGEWNSAARLDFLANLPQGGGTTPATLFVMNDATNLYLAVRVALPDPLYSSAGFEFDSDHDGIWPENGDDALVLNSQSGFYDDVRSNEPPCTPGSSPGTCGFRDTEVGGTNDGQGVVGNDGDFSFYEVSHPLDSGDAGRDFALAPGSTVGFFMDLVLCSGGCADTYVPPMGTGGVGLGAIVIASTANTGVGSDVPVEVDVTLPGGGDTTVSLTFDSVDTPGNTSVATSETGPPPASGFKLGIPPVYYEITTTATFSGSVRVCIGWSEGQFANENHIRLFHREGSGWVDITDVSSLDPVGNTVCGITTSFSPFALMETKYPFTGFFQPVDNPPAVNSVRAGAAVPVKFSLGGDLGLDIFAQDYPRAELVRCETGSAADEVETTVTAGASTLTYDALTGQYIYVWKTSQAWAGSCRALRVKLNDGEEYTARFSMRR